MIFQSAALVSHQDPLFFPYEVDRSISNTHLDQLCFCFVRLPGQQITELSTHFPTSFPFLPIYKVMSATAFTFSTEMGYFWTQTSRQCNYTCVVADILILRFCRCTEFRKNIILLFLMKWSNQRTK